jgi:mRNA interferase RelE/StbE
MIFELSFLPQALREWNRLDGGIRDQFKKELAELDRYKIKLRAAGFRLVYELRDRDAFCRQAERQ